MMYNKLIKRLRDMATSDGNIKSNYIGLTLLQAADAIEELQLYVDLYKDLTEKGEKVARKVIDKYPRWIPATEQLPKENGFYLCLYKHKASGGVAMDEGLSILQWINNKWGINDIYLVTHWMPLPEPPKDGK